MTHAIVIPLFNKAGYISKTLHSLIRQSKLPDELVIVDDGSTDDSLLITRNFLRDHATELGNCEIKLIALPENKGPGNARNIGFAATTCQLISFLDATTSTIPRCWKSQTMHLAGTG